MRRNLQHAIERVERPGGSHEGVGREKFFCLFAGGFVCLVFVFVLFAVSLLL